MADILIRGMEIPDGCHNCGFSYFDKGETNDGESCTVLMCSAMNQGTNGAEYDGNRPSWCPIVPIPEGHGRLGDLDALQEEFKKFHDGKRLMLIDTAPTIVPAEGGSVDEKPV